MIAYRLYHMSNRTGHIERCDVIDARDDVDAVRIVGRMATTQARELWQEARRIRRFERIAETGIVSNDAAGTQPAG